MLSYDYDVPNFTPCNFVSQVHPESKLQEAALFVVGNLVWRGEGGAAQRQSRLAELGVLRALRQLHRRHNLHDKYVYFI